MKTVFITGASSGIGFACAEIFAREKYNLLLASRRVDRLHAMATDLQNKYGVQIHAIGLDVRDKNLVQKVWDELPENWKVIDVLINNAGLSQGLEPIQEGNTDDWDRMIDTNLKGLLYVTRAVAPAMQERKTGHIINIGSIAGKEVYPNGNVYCSTKHAVDALTKAMRIDLLPYNIKVTSVDPGAVETEFSVVRFKGDRERAKKVYEGFTPLSAEDVAEAIWFAASRPPHVNVNDLLLMPTAQATGTLFHKEP
ncbi:MAG: SDR family oxidoreductase [Pseudosphingobacterium sp.]|nr:MULTISPECIES: SDR family oxidoreductase [Olivibacter]MDM8173906.1 SDR family oxidoreductase [Olivibacter sp. 47]MDX3915090.1 SDR family oxidoreductase [Pseudosphingobacterium sp.]QEL03693.1 SDR family oxidoreductase [Olivibacter sp. LS-1]